MYGVLRHPEGTGEYKGSFIVEECTYMSPATREFGQARIRLPRFHPAVRRGVIPSFNGLRVFVHSAWFPTWHGIVLGEPTRNADGSSTYTAHEIGKLSDKLKVRSGRLFTYAPAGAIFEAAVKEALEGRPIASLGEGSFLMAPPLIPSYRLEIKSLQQVAIELADLTKQEWEITEDGRINWVPPTGPVYDPVLMEGHDLVDVQRSADSQNRFARIIAYDRYGRPAEATAPELIGDLTAGEDDIRVNTDDQATVQAHADARLEITRYPSVRFSAYLQPGGTGTLTFGFGEGPFGMDPFGGVGGGAPHWSGVRLGGFISAILPSVEPNGECIVARVLSITLGDNLPMPRLGLQQIHLLSRATLPRARHGDSPPPQRNTGFFSLIAGANGRKSTLITPEQFAPIPAKKLADKLTKEQIQSLGPEQLDAPIDAGSADQLGGTLDIARYGVTAGTATANRPLVVDGNKRTDELVIGTLRLGAGAGTAVTASATDLNKTTGIEAGSTANPQQTAVVNATSLSLDPIEPHNSGDPTNDEVPSLQSVQARLSDIEADINTLKADQVNALLSRARSANIIAT